MSLLTIFFLCVQMANALNSVDNLETNVDAAAVELRNLSAVVDRSRTDTLSKLVEVIARVGFGKKEKGLQMKKKKKTQS